MRVLRFFAGAVTFHGILLGLASAYQTVFLGDFPGKDSELIGLVYFWIMAVPALVLTFPFHSILWKCGLMNAPGWFAWPKPIGIALAYAVWVVILLGLAQIVQWKHDKNEPA
ncbi:MAG: hypothetical protein EPN94_10880 [Nitrospirae bacterium]|nr:MAG: hypothetical protein EPN94_10880 [Nitrospirota bacterium]